MSENRVVIRDEDGSVRVRSDKEIVDENAAFAQELKNKVKPKVDLDAVLKEKKAKRKKAPKEDEMTVMLVDQPDRSINFGVIGLGQAGSKVAEEFYNLGYSTVIANTATQDLNPIKIPNNKKLFLDSGPLSSGAGKNLEAGEEAAEQYRDEILKHVEDNTDGCEILMLITSGSGGTGSGSIATVIDILGNTGKPLMVLYILPMSSEDAQSKHNAVQTLAKLSKLAANDIINSLVVVDNAKIESIYEGLSLKDFWKTANQAIVNPIHLFNTLSSKDSEHVSLDGSDMAQVMLEGDCMLYGMMNVENYQEDEALAEAMVMNLENGLLSSDFNLEETRSAGIIITGSAKALAETSASSVEYAFSMVSKICDESVKIFRGVYEATDHPDYLRVYSFFSGLGLPADRVSELKLEAERHMESLKNKVSDRANGMNIDLGKTATVSNADKVYKKIQSKKSGMGKLRAGSKSKVIDRRRR